jgi:hypothetical protein
MFTSHHISTHLRSYITLYTDHLLIIYHYITPHHTHNISDPVERFIEEQTAPTPPGEEPKSIKLAKTVAWGE